MINFESIVLNYNLFQLKQFAYTWSVLIAYYKDQLLKKLSAAMTLSS